MRLIGKVQKRTFYQSNFPRWNEVVIDIKVVVRLQQHLYDIKTLERLTNESAYHMIENFASFFVVCAIQVEVAIIGD